MLGQNCFLQWLYSCLVKHITPLVKASSVHGAEQ
jgi:hypothetical protein